MSTSPALILLWILLLVAVAYYLLNLTVGVMCLNYSESVREEEQLLLAAQDEDEDDDDEEVRLSDLSVLMTECPPPSNALTSSSIR